VCVEQRVRRSRALNRLAALRQLVGAAAAHRVAAALQLFTSAGSMASARLAVGPGRWFGHPVAAPANARAKQQSSFNTAALACVSAVHAPTPGHWLTQARRGDFVHAGDGTIAARCSASAAGLPAASPGADSSVNRGRAATQAFGQLVQHGGQCRLDVAAAGVEAELARHLDHQGAIGALGDQHRRAAKP
jgi:hypothetical protein